MKKIILLLFLALFFHLNIQAQCDSDDEIKVLLVGDSWAFFMTADLTFNNVFERWGHSNYFFITTINLAENGAQTDDFLEADKQEDIQQILDSTPSIKAVHLSIGGNDFLGNWHVDMTEEEVDSLTENIFGRLESVVDFVKQARPGITVVLSGYAYPNFEEVIEDADPFQEFHPFYDRWEGMGFPSFLEINNLLNEVSENLADYAASDPQVEFVNSTGILQHTFGQEDPVGVSPGGTYAAGTTPMPYGIPEMPTPKNAMRDYELTKDCFHLSARGYRDFIGYQTRKFYHKFLMDDQQLLAVNADQNGSISSADVVYSELLLGEIEGESHSTVLTFNTFDAPVDAIIEKAQIFLRIENMNGNNPIGGKLDVKIKSGNFGESVELEAIDYIADADAQELSCRFGSNDNAGHWIRLDLPSEMIPFITNSIAAELPTQFIISSPEASGGMVTFTGTADPELAPVLNLKYDPSFTSPVADLQDWIEQISVFPNPTSNVLQIKNNGISIQEIHVLNIIGEIQSIHKTSLNTIDLSSMAEGIYLIQFFTEKGMLTNKVVKQ
ncbi:MAG: lysophospholipase L1-like esterase [Maribacter sp.]|jgi:lysophospholipase L1-like esterase